MTNSDHCQRVCSSCRPKGLLKECGRPKGLLPEGELNIPFDYFPHFIKGYYHTLCTYQAKGFALLTPPGKAMTDRDQMTDEEWRQAGIDNQIEWLWSDCIDEFEGDQDEE